MQCHPHSYGLGLSAIRATAAANGLYDLDLFAAFADDQMIDVSNFREPPTGEVRRTPLPRTSVNKGKKRKGHTQSSSRALQDAGYSA
jgi:hypothetical protein